MTIDHRGFRYALEPMRRRQAWQLEALESRLTRANQEVAAAAEQLLASKRHLEVQHGQVLVAATRGLDPACQRRSLWWLAQLREQIALAQTELKALQATCCQLQVEYVTQRNKRDAIEQHRADCLAAYAQTEQNRQASVADVDWLARVQAGALETTDLEEPA